MSIVSSETSHSHYECGGSCCDRELLAVPLTFPVAVGLTAPNRIMKASMSEQLCKFDKKEPANSGIPSKLLVDLYKKFAEGRSGILVTGSIMVDPCAYEAPGNVVINKSVESTERRNAFREWTKVGKSCEGLMIAQIMHPGVRASKYATDVVFNPSKVDKDELEDLFDKFILAGLYAEIYGFDGVEIPCVWDFTLGYLLNADLNKRTDEYGGAFENRTRCLLKIIDRIRKLQGLYFICVLSIADLSIAKDAANLASQFNKDDFAVFVRKLEDHGIDYISFSGGSVELLLDSSGDIRGSLDAIDATYLEVANTLKKLTRKAKVFLNCGSTLCNMSEVLRRNLADGVVIGRQLATDPSEQSNPAGDPGRTRTCNLRLRRATPYPLGHRAGRSYLEILLLTSS
uniref:Oxidored_FMN domain-containing protein n=1 Tax=Syphacia muris TaxID=451379 RepID=A0A0N5AQ63_9BILA